MARNPTLRQLQKALGEKYSIKTIDFEECLYRDFGNGFNVEISGCSRPNTKEPATIYLWFGDTICQCTIVYQVEGVLRTPERIHAVVEHLYHYSNKLIEAGCTNLDMARKFADYLSRTH